MCFLFFFFSSRRRHTRLQGDWSSDVCSSDLGTVTAPSDGSILGKCRPASMPPKKATARIVKKPRPTSVEPTRLARRGGRLLKRRVSPGAGIVAASSRRRAVSHVSPHAFRLQPRQTRIAARGRRCHIIPTTLRRAEKKPPPRARVVSPPAP